MTVSDPFLAFPPKHGRQNPFSGVGPDRERTVTNHHRSKFSPKRKFETATQKETKSENEANAKSAGSCGEVQEMLQRDDPLQNTRCIKQKKYNSAMKEI